ncbi:MAG: amidophosphoribosyltransferase [Sedimentisphaerales bacterium]|nr:amidophosphoribosyltransferase [Sedimentisphaerales bacterium]MBN2842412.1 amidophosphoribosyltransferase [Sedimentisphaerales bacterium]
MHEHSDQSAAADHGVVISGPDKKENCGVVGIYGHPNATDLCVLAMHALQHRGQESAGIAVSNGEDIRGHVGMGLVSDVFPKEQQQKMTTWGDTAIGHVRYSTAGSSNIANAQPMLVEYSLGQMALAHNGNLVNAMLLRDEYEAHGHIFKGTSDTEVIIHLLAKPTHISKPDTFAHVCRHLQGSFCLLLLTPEKIEAARDARGIRPLCIGRFANGGYIIASETCALDIVDAELVREVEPGEIVTIDKNGLHSRYYEQPGTVKPAHCIFEQVYFANPSSMVFGENVHNVRLAMGRQLAREAGVDADIVVPVPNCATCAAQGYAQESGIPYDRGFTVSHYAGRSFIEPEQPMRDLAVKMKLNVIREVVEGKRVIVIEDSIVRGTTTRGKMSALRRAGAKEIHLRVASPPIKNPCFYGIDFPSKKELIANERSVEEIAKYLGIDSLHYISLEGMLSCVSKPADHYCNACWSGKYPISVDEIVTRYSQDRFQKKLFE